LERQLTAAEGLAASPASCSPFLSEQIELLGEVAKQLHAWLRRFSRGLEPGLEPIQAHLLLLDHLAGLPHLAQGAC
jgi:hypothetical protein